MSSRRLFCAFLVATSMGCGAGAPVHVVDTPAQRSAGGRAMTAPRGLDAPGNDPEVVALAKPPPVDSTAQVTSVHAVRFSIDWRATPPTESRERFPPGLYRVEGVVVGVSDVGGQWLELTIGGADGDTLALELAGSHARAARASRRGDAAKALCAFKGTIHGRRVTFEECRWEGK